MAIHNRDYSQPGDPYRIAQEYTAQSADQDVIGEQWNKAGGDRDVRGNSVMKPRGVPTQAEADAIRRSL